MKTPTVGLAILLLLSACHQSKPPVDLPRISVGMTKQEAIEQLGRPDKVAVSGGVEYLQYEAYEGYQVTEARCLIYRVDPTAP